MAISGTFQEKLPSSRLVANSARNRLRMRLSPGPISWSAGSRNAMASTSANDSSTTSFNRWPSSVRGRWMPGVSTSTICAWSVVRMPRMALRVVSGREEAMATCVPINALISVDLPTFGRPTTATNPDLYTVWSCVC